MATQKINGVYHVSNRSNGGGGGGGDDPEAVKFTPQTLSSSEQAQARSNIGAGTSSYSGSPVEYTQQSLTAEQKAQARSNIGAGTYSKPSGGIPASDLAAGVIPSVPGSLTMLQLPVAGTYTRSNFESTYCTVADLLKVVSGEYTTVSVDYDNGTTETTRELPAGGASTETSGSKTCEVYITFGEEVVTISFAESSGDIVVTEKSIPTVPTISTNIATDKASDTMTASPKAVYDAINPSVQSSQPSGGMLPNVLYKLGTLTGSVTISFASPTDNAIENEYKFGFTAGSTAPTITWPASITKWAGNALDSGLPNVEASTYYEVSVLNGMGIFNKFE